ncbi:MAG: hypothetical protein PVF58_03790 [Candidatus Methanofastidiosia archaeon]|jgi:hypothetical protein
MIEETLHETFSLALTIFFPLAFTILLPSHWSKRKKAICFILSLVAFFIIRRYFFFFIYFIEENLPYIGFFAIILMILLILKKEITFLFRNMRMKYKEIIYANISAKDKVIREYVQDLKIEICQMAEECIIAINSKKPKEAARIFKIIIEIFDLLQKNNMTRYLKFAIDKYDENLSKFLDSESRNLEKVPSLIQNNPEDLKDFLESFIFKIYPEYQINEFALEKAKIKELRDKIHHIEIQNIKNSILKMNFKIWGKYFPPETPSTVYSLYLSVGFIFVAFILIVFLPPSLFLFVLIMTLFIFMYFPRYILRPDSSTIDWAKNILLENLQEMPQKKLPSKMPIINTQMWSIRTSIKASGIIKNIAELAQISDESVKKLNYSILIYFLTTFPKEKIEEFTPLNRENLTETSWNLKPEEIGNSSFFLRQWKIYVLCILSIFGCMKRNFLNILALFEIIFGLILLFGETIGLFLQYKYPIIRSLFQYKSFIIAFLISISLIYSGSVIKLKKFRIKKWYLQLLNFSCSIILIICFGLLILGEILMKYFYQNIPLPDNIWSLFLLPLLSIIIILPNLILLRESLPFLWNLMREKSS